MKKYFEINNHFKKYLPIFMIMLSIMILMGTSYALLRNSQKGENTYVMNVGLLEVTFVDSETNALTLTDMYPMTDEEGQLIEKELSFTVKNTGDFDAKYNVYIEETSTNPAFKTVIRFISNKNDTGYNDPKTLSENYYVDEMASLAVGETATYKVKFWLLESADTTYMDKTFTARVVVEAIQDTYVVGYIKNSINNSTCNPSITDTDGTIYLSGTNDCVNFNYVWYSGKLWRITAIYPDGTMKLITDDIITTISYGSNNVFYTDEENNSYMYQWLNEDFLDTLYNHENIITENSKWNATVGNGRIEYKLPETTMVSAKVGLLNSYEYYMSYKNTTSQSGYLNVGYFWWLSNPYKAGSSDVWYVLNSGYSSYISPSNFRGARPSINLKSTIELSGGSGTKTNPYTIKGDKEEVVANTTLLNTRSSGEYVSVNNQLFRIVGIENNTTKLNKVDYIRDTNDEVMKKAFASTVTFGLSTNTQNDAYWDYYLNNTWLKAFDSTYNENEDTSDILVKGTYYTNALSYGSNYKGTICTTASNTVSIKNCEKTTSTWNGYVGLPRYGEMFASEQGSGYSTSIDTWLITPSGSSYVWFVGNSGNSGPSGNYHAARPSINLKSEIVITGGKGLKGSPYEVSLPTS